MDERTPSDNAILATAVTALLIREGGRTVFDPGEWQQAIDHEGTLFINRHGEREDVLIVLLPKEVGEA